MIILNVFTCTEKVNFWGERRDYWHYLTEGLGNMKELDSCVKIVQVLPQVGEIMLYVSTTLCVNVYAIDWEIFTSKLILAC